MYCSWQQADHWTKKLFRINNFEDSQEFLVKIIYVLKSLLQYPNNGGRPNIALTEYNQEHFLFIDQQVEANAAKIQEQEDEDDNRAARK